MSPEYAMHGQFSMKSDVYSFGIIVLEIISGKRNITFYQTDGDVDLATYVRTIHLYFSSLLQNIDACILGLLHLGLEDLERRSTGTVDRSCNKRDL